MWRKFFTVVTTLSFALAVLFITLFRIAAVKYEFRMPSTDTSKVLGDTDIQVDYNLPYPGRVLPDSPFWSLKALRDKVWLRLTTNSARRAELKLLFADKRLGMAKLMFDKGKPEEGFSILTKAEKYLEEASWQERENRHNGLDTSEFLEQLAKASLKHYEVMEDIYVIAPEEARPAITQTQDYAKRAYEESRNALLDKDRPVPDNPFNW